MSRRIPMPRTSLQVVAVLAGGLILVAAGVEGLDALVGSDDPPRADPVPEAAVERPAPEIRVEGDGTIVVDFGGHDQTRIRIEGGETDTAALASCLERGLARVMEEEREADPGGPDGWMARISANRKFRNRFREVERGCMGGLLDPALGITLDPGRLAIDPIAANGSELEIPTELRGSFDRFRGTPGLDGEVLAMGLRALAHARALRGDVARNRLTIIDYSLPSTEKRLWVLDLDADEVLFHERVAHGKGTGLDVAESFSNAAGSLASSLGTFVTGETYEGRHGHSLRLVGLEPGINDQAMDRAIVVHGADYVSTEFIDEHGRLGRSWGCPAVREAVVEDLIDAIRDGTVLFTWFPDPDFVAASTYIR